MHVPSPLFDLAFREVASHTYSRVLCAVCTDAIERAGPGRRQLQPTLAADLARREDECDGTDRSFSSLNRLLVLSASVKRRLRVCSSLAMSSCCRADPYQPNRAVICFGVARVASWSAAETQQHNPTGRCSHSVQFSLQSRAYLLIVHALREAAFQLALTHRCQLVARRQLLDVTAKLWHSIRQSRPAAHPLCSGPMPSASAPYRFAVTFAAPRAVRAQELFCLQDRDLVLSSRHLRLRCKFARLRLTSAALERLLRDLYREEDGEGMRERTWKYCSSTSAVPVAAR